VRIRSVEFVGAIAKPGGPAPQGLPEVAFSGRSNVGKSTLINSLLRRTRSPIARVSNTPGKTREINFFQVDALPGKGPGATELPPPSSDSMEFFLVDLPGYGYARVPEHLRAAWKPLIETYLGQSAALRGVLQLIDVRRDPTDEDLQMLTFLAELGTPTLVVLTKMDKLKRSARDRKIHGIVERLGLDLEQIVPFSAVTGEGRDELLTAVEGLLRGAES